MRRQPVVSLDKPLYKWYNKNMLGGLLGVERALRLTL